MATAKKLPVQPVVPNIALELTPAEAQFLADLLAFVGGSPEGRRRHSDGILNALRNVDITFQDEEHTGMLGRIRCEAIKSSN